MVGTNQAKKINIRKISNRSAKKSNRAARIALEGMQVLFGFIFILIAAMVMSLYRK